tara:strand:- start:544 stop:1152 length:609 start_codon:yes stop_codon:yes gene_type:complete
MPLQPLFQYVNRQDLERLQQLAEDITAYGVIRNNEFGKAVLIQTGDEHHSNALGLVSSAISDFHRYDSPYEQKSPDFDEQFADTHPNTFFVQTDGDHNYVPPKMESSPPIDTTPSPARLQRFSKGSDLISALLLKYYLDSHSDLCGDSSDDTMKTMTKYSRVARQLKGSLGITEEQISDEAFRDNISRICEKYVTQNPDLYP